MSARSDTRVPEFSDAALRSNTGHTRLSWASVKGSEYEVQQARSAIFEQPKHIYRGGDTAIFVSGLKDGEYFFRVRGLSSGESPHWSRPLHLKVTHHSLKTALILFALGLIAFTAIVFVILRGHFHVHKKASRR